MNRMKKARFLRPEELAEMRRKKPKDVPPPERRVFKTAEWYARTMVLMCEDFGKKNCRGCPLGTNRDESGDLILCMDFQRRYPAEAVKRVELWWIENQGRYPEYVRKEDR